MRIKQVQRAALQQQIAQRWIMLALTVVFSVIGLLAIAHGHAVIGAGGGLASLIAAIRGATL